MRQGRKILGLFLAAVLAISSFPLTTGFGAVADTTTATTTTTNTATPITGAASPTALASTQASHDLSTGPLTLTANHGDIRVYGSYQGDETAIFIEDGYRGTLTLDNVSIDTTGAAVEIDTAQKLTINFEGTNKLQAFYPIRCDLTTHPEPLSSGGITLAGNGTLEIIGRNWASLLPRGGIIVSVGIHVDGNLIIDVETLINGEDGIHAEDLIINAPTTIICNEGFGIDGEVGIRCSGDLFINAPTNAPGDSCNMRKSGI